jgi:hypothetical protein
MKQELIGNISELTKYAMVPSGLINHVVWNTSICWERYDVILHLFVVTNIWQLGLLFIFMREVIFKFIRNFYA